MNYMNIYELYSNYMNYTAIIWIIQQLYGDQLVIKSYVRGTIVPTQLCTRLPSVSLLFVPSWIGLDDDDNDDHDYNDTDDYDDDDLW